MSEFKKCPNGHYYRGDKCPYCQPKEFHLTKVCPNGHGYSDKDKACPFCGDKEIVQTLNDNFGINNTLFYTDLLYEKDGLRIHDLKAIVDGRVITGKIRLRVYYTSFYKYNYCVAIDRELEIPISAESKVVLQGIGFTDSFTGTAFYKMCDSLFNKQEENANNEDDSFGIVDDIQKPGEELRIIPICPHCGQPLRNSVPHHFDIGSIEGNAFDGKVPWNYLWDGRCECCGHDFSITMHQKIHTQQKDRYTTVRASARCIERDLSDDLIGLSGVEIEQRNSIDGLKKTFISTNELKYLINALKNSPLLKQLDWYEDRT